MFSHIIQNVSARAFHIDVIEYRSILESTGIVRILVAFPDRPMFNLIIRGLGDSSSLMSLNIGLSWGEKKTEYIIAQIPFHAQDRYKNFLKEIVFTLTGIGQPLNEC